MALGGPTVWSFEGGFGSAGTPGWGSLGGWMDVITGAPNPFRMGGSPVYVPPVISEIPDSWEEYEAQFPEYFEPILETRPGRTPDPYPQDISEETSSQDDEVDDMAIDWGAVISGGIDIIQGQQVGGGYAPAGLAPPQARDSFLAGGVPPSGGGTGGGDCDGMTWGGGAPPKGYKVVRDSCGNGVLRKVRRRRRRRMLTQGDKSDIAAIVSMVGKGQLASSLINRSTS